MRPLILVAAVMGLVTACNERPQPSAAPTITPQDIESVRSAIADLKKPLTTMSDRIAELEQKVQAQEFIQSLEKRGFFDPSQPKGGYQKIESSTGYFLVSLQDVQPYLDGQRVTLHIGNPMSVLYSGFKLKVSWSARRPQSKDKDFAEKYSAWEASRGEKEIPLTEDLRPGAWNKVSFVVAPAKAEQFGRLEIQIDTNQVKMQR